IPKQREGARRIGSATRELRGERQGNPGGRRATPVVVRGDGGAGTWGVGRRVHRQRGATAALDGDRASEESRDRRSQAFGAAAGEGDLLQPRLEKRRLPLQL